MRLIDKDALIEAIREEYFLHDNRKLIIRLIEQQPSAKPEIIRCKDCVKCGFCGDETNLEIMGFYGFCSRAERRTDE